MKASGSARYLFGLILLFSFAVQAQVKMPACGSYAQFYSKDSINIITFGASTVQGIPAPLNFQTPLKSFLENCYKGKPVMIANHGVAGETTSDGLKRFDAAIANRTGFLLISMGVNDAIQIADGKARVSTTVDNMREMIARANKNKLNVILGTLQYCVEPTGNSPEARLAQRRNRVIDLINAAYRNLAKELDVRLADFNSVIGKNKQLYSDALHPNSRGYQVLAFVFFDAINQEISAYFQAVSVLQNYPNPASALTKLRFNLSSAAAVKVSLYNTVGQRLGVVLDDYRNAGYHEEEISIQNYPPGLYFLYFEILNLKFTKKLVIVR
jgi:acyl-CoA thioesterase-1